MENYKFHSNYKKEWKCGLKILYCHKATFTANFLLKQFLILSPGSR